MVSLKDSGCSSFRHFQIRGGWECRLGRRDAPGSAKVISPGNDYTYHLGKQCQKEQVQYIEIYAEQQSTGTMAAMKELTPIKAFCEPNEPLVLCPTLGSAYCVQHMSCQVNQRSLHVI